MQSTLIQYTQIPQAELERLLTLRLETLLREPTVTQTLASLDVPLLKETLPTAGSILSEHLPPFYHWLKHELGLQRVPDGPDHTTRWVVGFLRDEESIAHLVELHRPVPRPALEAAIPRLVGLFDAVDDAAIQHAWKQAIATLCLVLAVAAREAEADAA